MSVFNFTVYDNKSSEKKMSDYQGKVLLIVNTASKCGFTPQYDGLEALYKKYADQGFEVLAFPCNQFGKQEPGSSEEIKEFCQLNFSTTFPLFQKVDVNGKDASDLFEFLKQKAPGVLGTKSIKWNFTKFLVDRTGESVQRFAPKVKPEDLISEIERLLK